MLIGVNQNYTPLASRHVIDRTHDVKFILSLAFFFVCTAVVFAIIGYEKAARDSRDLVLEASKNVQCSNTSVPKKTSAPIEIVYRKEIKR